MLFGSRMDSHQRGNHPGQTGVCTSSKEHAVLGLWDFFGFSVWKQAAATGADLLWRMKKISAWPANNVFRTARSEPSIRRNRTGGTNQWLASAGDRLPARRDRRCRAHLSARHDYPDAERLRRPNWPRSITSAGKSKPLSTNSRPICAARRWRSAVKLLNWYGRSSMA